MITKQTQGADLVFVHLSDIHFSKPGAPELDLDVDLRRELERDLEVSVREFGAVSAILVTGDIAYSGKAEEYEIASEWLKEICDIASCPHERALVVPGNHDVERAAVTGSSIVELLHEELHSCHVEQIDGKLRRHLEDCTGGPALLASIQQYNQFAAQYGCDISPAKPWWETAFTLNDRSSLIVRGMSSTLVSGLEGQSRDKLLLGRAQAQLQRRNGVCHLTMAHHPPDWLRDHDGVGELLDTRAKIQLSGHKHYHRVQKREECLVIGAGAVHPSRRESGWLPRYNVLALSVVGTGEERKLRVSVQPRVWSSAGTCFSEEAQPGGGTTIVRDLVLEDWTAVDPVSEDGGIAPSGEELPMPEPIDQNESGAASRRRLVYAFYGLGFADRLRVTESLGLVKDDDQGLPSSELLKRALCRAAEEHCLGKLWVSVSKLTPGGIGDNPFAAV